MKAKAMPLWLRIAEVIRILRERCYIVQSGNVKLVFATSRGLLADEVVLRFLLRIGAIADLGRLDVGFAQCRRSGLCIGFFPDDLEQIQLRAKEARPSDRWLSNRRLYELDTDQLDLLSVWLADQPPIHAIREQYSARELPRQRTLGVYEEDERGRKRDWSWYED